MSHTLRAALIAGAAAIALAACSQSASTPGGFSNLPSQSQSAQSSSKGDAGVLYHPACPQNPPIGQATCFALVRDDAGGVGVDSSGTIRGIEPAQFQQAYNINTTGGTGQTIAVVDAYDNPNAAGDLAAYRTQWALPACGSGCFEKVNQTGQQSNYPSPNKGWGLEEDLDIEMISATCPNCKIILVEANSNYLTDLGASVQEAVKLGATVVSNSYGGGEFSGEDTGSDYQQSIPVLASAGDAAYGTQYPAASQYVISIGGTTLTSGGGGARGWTETVWHGTGSGCAQYASKPTWQKDKSCKNRTMNDISWDASPSTGPAMYDTYQYSGWLVVGGTSVSSPAIAGEIGDASANGLTNAGYIYKHHGKKMITDITSGNNGTCTPAYYCTAEKKYDGPTGWGTPYGMKAL